MTASTLIALPICWRAPAGQMLMQLPQRVQLLLLKCSVPASSCQLACLGQALTQAPQPTHLCGKNISCGSKRQDSGLAHQRQRSWQPLKNTVVRIPSPSFTDRRCIWKILHGFIGRTLDDGILCFLGQVDKLRAITCYTHQQIAVFLRTFLRLVQYLG